MTGRFVFRGTAVNFPHLLQCMLSPVPAPLTTSAALQCWHWKRISASVAAAVSTFFAIPISRQRERAAVVPDKESVRRVGANEAPSTRASVTRCRQINYGADTVLLI